MFAHYIIIVDRAAGTTVLVGSSHPVYDVEWPRVYFVGGSWLNLSTSRIKDHQGTALSILGPGAPSYIPPAALNTSPPRGSQVTTVTRVDGNTTVVQRPNGITNVIND